MSFGSTDCSSRSSAPVGSIIGLASFRWRGAELRGPVPVWLTSELITTALLHRATTENSEVLPSASVAVAVAVAVMADPTRALPRLTLSLAGGAHVDRLHPNS